MEGFYRYLETLKAKKTEIENQDVESFVKAKIVEIEQQVRAEALKKQAEEIQLLDVKIEAITDAISVVESEKVEESNLDKQNFSNL